MAGPLSSLVPGATVTWNLCTEDQTVRKGCYQGVAAVGGDGQAGSRAPMRAHGEMGQGNIPPTATQPRMNNMCREVPRHQWAPLISHLYSRILPSQKQASSLRNLCPALRTLCVDSSHQDSQCAPISEMGKQSSGVEYVSSCV